MMKETNHAKKEDFFIAVGSGKISPQHVVQRVIQSLNREGGKRRRGVLAALPCGAQGDKRGAVGRASWASGSMASRTWPSAFPSAAAPSQVTTWLGTSLSGAASPSTGATVPTSRLWRRTRSALPPCTGTLSQRPAAGGDPGGGLRP